MVSGTVDFSGGMNSSISPSRIEQNQYAMGMNVVRRGGTLRTRPGYTSLFNLPCGRLQGFTMFRPSDSQEYLVAAVDGKIYVSRAPFDTFTVLNGIKFSKSARFVEFEKCIQTSDYDANGLLYALDTPKNILVMQDRKSRAAFWDGGTARHLNPKRTNVYDADGNRVTRIGYDETPIGLWMAWAGNRLWVSRGSLVFASDIGNPLKFTETEYLAEGRAFTMPEEVTGMIQPASGDALIVFGESTFTTLQANILDRTQWLNTADFQKTEYGIGCVAPKSIVNKLGLTWWYSASGWTNLNFALTSFNDSTKKYIDEHMHASKAYMSKDRAGICAGEIENYILISVPSGSMKNRHTWVLDIYGGNAVWDGFWTGVNPVQWGKATIDGVERIFFASSDADGVNRVWEAFRPDQTDNGEPITSYVLTRVDNFGSKDVKRYRYSQLFLNDIYGDVDIYGGVSGQHSGFRRILTKRMRASSGSIDSTLEYGADDVFASNRPQYRVVRTQDADAMNNTDPCDTCGIESDIIFPMDREFQHLFVWSGCMSIEAIRSYAQESQISEDYRGECEEDEISVRALNESGCSAIGDVAIGTPFDLYESSQSFTVSCDTCGSIGSSSGVAYATSMISQDDADKKAIGLAKLNAYSEYICTTIMSISDGNGILISDQDGSIIAFESSSTEDACRGEETGLAPIIVLQPVGGTFSEGDEITLSVLAIGTSPITYQWYKDGSAIDLATDPDYYIESMHIDNIGSYYCVATNDLGSDTSESASIYGVRMYSAGSNWYGEMGFNYDSISYDTFMLNEFKNIKKIISNGGNSFMLLNDGELYFSGYNGNGEGGVGHTSQVNEWTLSATGVVDVFLGGDNTSFYIGEDNKLYFSGNNWVGQAGNGASQNQYNEWVHVADNAIFACGSANNTSFYIDTEYNLHYSGGNSAYEAGVSSTGEVHSWSPCGITAKKIVCGWSDSMIIRPDNTVWVAGTSYSGAFGLGTTYVVQQWTECTSLSGVSAKDICISAESPGSHALVLSEEDNVYASGGNSAGELGLGDGDNRYAFEQVASGVSYISCGYRFSMLLTNDNRVLVSGYNGSGMHGDGTYQYKNVFTEVTTGVVGIMESSSSQTSFILKQQTGPIG